MLGKYLRCGIIQSNYILQSFVHFSRVTLRYTHLMGQASTTAAALKVWEAADEANSIEESATVLLYGFQPPITKMDNSLNNLKNCEYDTTPIQTHLTSSHDIYELLTSCPHSTMWACTKVMFSNFWPYTLHHPCLRYLPGYSTGSSPCPPTRSIGWSLSEEWRNCACYPSAETTWRRLRNLTISQIRSSSCGAHTTPYVHPNDTQCLLASPYPGNLRAVHIIH